MTTPAVTPPAAPTAPPVAAPSAARVASVDIIRGAVMVLMAIDHVRVYSGLPAGGPTPGIFFTRWVTHFCAPAFIFLAGTAAFFHGQKLGSTARLSRWLASRGAWLILLELTALRLAWTFNLDFGSYLLAGVIWVIGWCMILLAALAYLPVAITGAVGVTLIVAHNAAGPALGAAAQQSALGWLWQMLYYGGPISLGTDGPTFFVLYSVIPWIGVMAAGYAFGAILRWEPRRRTRACLAIGGATIAAFLLLRGFHLYGDPRPWGAAGSPMPGWLSFLNTTKYPASLSFLLMTLGPTIVLIPALEGARGRLAGWLTVFGRVPFFYYLLHIPFIHAVALLVSWLRLGHVSPWLFTNHPVMPGELPEGYLWSLGLLYLITVLVVVALYFPCRWYANVKARSRSPWLSYL